MNTRVRRILSLLSCFCVASIFANDVVIHTSAGSGYDQVYVDPPGVTFDDDMNQLHVYFGSTSTIEIECIDSTGMSHYICHEGHYGGQTIVYSNLGEGFYTITIRSIYGITYTGNFSVI